MKKQVALEKLAEALDYESYQWLLRNQPEIAAHLEQAVAAGASLDELKRTAWNHTQREEIVVRITNAARWLMLVDVEELAGVER